MSKELLRCAHLSKSYWDGNHDLQVLQDINLSLHDGELLAIVGSSGSGKSTLLHCLGGLDQPSSGEIFFRGEAIAKWSPRALAEWRNQQLGFIYQFHHLLPEFTALENVAMPLLIQGQSAQVARARAAELLARVGLAERGKHRPAELSGGERQRVAIARALANKPALILADEPTGNLDDESAQQVMQLMLELNAEMQTCFVIVTHDQQLAASLPRQITLQQGLLQAEQVAN